MNVLRNPGAWCTQAMNYFIPHTVNVLLNWVRCYSREDSMHLGVQLLLSC